MIDIQKYLIAWFIEFGSAQEYKWVVPSSIFWEYKLLFEYLADNWNAKTPEYYAVCAKIGNKKIIDMLERLDVSFVYKKAEYVEKLFNIYVTDTLAVDKSPMELLESVKETYIKLSFIKNQSIWWVTKVDSLMEKLFEDISDAIEYWDVNEGYKTGIATLDKYTWWLVKGRTMRVSAYSNTGKSALSYSVVNSALKQWAKVLYFTLEIESSDLRNRLLSNYYDIPIWKFEKKSALHWINIWDYAKMDLYISSNVFSITEIEKITKSVKPDVLVIDYVQLIEWDGKDEYNQMNYVSRKIRKIASENNIAIFDLSQVPNDWKEYRKWGVIPSKWSGELVAAASIVLVMVESKFPWKINLHIAKNRHWQKGKCIELVPNFETSSFQDNWEIEPDVSKF